MALIKFHHCSRRFQFVDSVTLARKLSLLSLGQTAGKEVMNFHCDFHEYKATFVMSVPNKHQKSLAN